MFFTIKEVAAELKISLSMVYALVARGELACHEFGSCKRVAESDLQQFLDEKRKSIPKLPRGSGRHF
ncbi:Helix-turn-helix domain protein [Rubripirellula lacrimiformis]|uniref:Helix-turn-helix domain protein n=1 Tax=Rubripirellula lacrimiformis TaxID=1930273 RepID=A0A517NK27_9BACT|nr:helix-turn-helix domain-containing protein [Rubripirellula lacrimiformis]QDT07492.1 Helix-turn-helix domain protein [Rubripirellula lacrimiformis]